jgi:hypothetical protein
VSVCAAAASTRAQSSSDAVGVASDASAMVDFAEAERAMGAAVMSVSNYERVAT